MLYFYRLKIGKYLVDGLELLKINFEHSEMFSSEVIRVGTLK